MCSTAAEVRAWLFARYKELETTDPDKLAALNAFIDDAFIELCKNRFGDKYCKAVGLYAAHFYALSPNSGIDGGSTSGPVTKEKVGDIEKSYGAGASSSKGASGTGFYQSTRYGQAFENLLRTTTNRARLPFVAV